LKYSFNKFSIFPKQYVLVFVLYFFHFNFFSQIIFSESIGSVASTTTIATHETNNGFDNNAFTMSGTADIRATTVSTGYTGASGNANVFFTSTSGLNFQISGISTVGYSNLSLTFGAYKSTNASDFSDFLLEFSSDGTNYTNVAIPIQPTGTGTSNWRLISVNLPIGANNLANLRLRWKQNGTTTQYRIDDIILESIPACVPDAQPTTQASSISATPLCNSTTINFTGGNGANNLVIMSTTNDITDPVDQTAYTANSVYGSGSTTGTNDYVVYKGNGSSVTVTGLSNNTTYYYKIVEFNGTSANCTENYLATTTVNSFTTGAVSEPTTNASNVTITPGCFTAEINFTGGNGAKALIVMSTDCTISNPNDQTAYTANSVFGSGSTTGAGDYVVYNNTGSTVNVSNLNSNTSYCIKIFEYNGNTANCQENYLTAGAVSATFTTLNTGCTPPHLTGVMINSCISAGCSEGDTEIIYGNAGDYSFVASAANVDISYNYETPLVNYTNSFVTNATTTAELNTAAGCSGTFLEGNDATIPAGGKFMVVDQNFCPAAYDWTLFCGNGPVYVLYSSDADWNSTGNFGNSATVNPLRYFSTSINCGAAGTFVLDYNYSPASLANGSDGDYVLFDKDGGEATYYGNNGCTVDPILLPIELTYFFATCEDELISIYWQTASENENSHFTIIRTKDGKNYEELGTIPGAGYSVSPINYSFSYQIDRSNSDYYYRLKQTDYNGDSQYSDFITAKCDFGGDLLIYPNPSSSRFILEGYEKNATLHIYNELGQLISKIQTDKITSEINLENQAQGIYLLKVISNNEVQTLRMILKK
jgi:hypothetical protein